MLVYNFVWLYYRPLRWPNLINNYILAWTDTDLVAQVVIFFIAGFEGISSEMCLGLYELALNPEVQERLAKEIKENDAKHGGKLDYNSILDMNYLDMFISGEFFIRINQ